MDTMEFLDVLERYPFLREGLAEHRDEVLRLAGRILMAEAAPIELPDLPADAPEWERTYWQRWQARHGVCVSCGKPFRRGSGNRSEQCHGCATAGVRYEDGLG